MNRLSLLVVVLLLTGAAAFCEETFNIGGALTPTLNDIALLPTRFASFNQHDDAVTASYTCCKPWQEKEILKAIKANQDFLNRYPNSDCKPAVADVNRALDIRTKQRLVICDALRILFDRGPSFHAECVLPDDAVLVSKDPVALDYQALQLIEACRKTKGLCPLSEVKYPPLYVATAAGYELGTNDPEKINLAVHNFGG